MHRIADPVKVGVCFYYGMMGIDENDFIPLPPSISANGITVKDFHVRVFALNAFLSDPTDALLRCIFTHPHLSGLSSALRALFPPASTTYSDSNKRNSLFCFISKPSSPI
jgi:hypothetical protein